MNGYATLLSTLNNSRRVTIPSWNKNWIQETAQFIRDIPGWTVTVENSEITTEYGHGKKVMGYLLIAEKGNG